jgi:hypothetical protein
MVYSSQIYRQDIFIKITLLIIAALAGCIIFSGCSKSKIPEDKLVNIYADIVIARDTTANPSISREELDKSVFRKHNVTEEDYVQSIKSMNDNPEQWGKFFDKVIVHIQTIQKK